MSAMERTELKMAVIAEQLGLSWAGKRAGILQIRSHVLQIFPCLTSWIGLLNNIRPRQPASGTNKLLLPSQEPQSEGESGAAARD